MSELRNMPPTQPSTPEGGSRALQCQWCSVPLADGVTICPTCGSPGIPDPRMTVAGLTDMAMDVPDPLAEAVVAHGVTGGEAELVEWWHNDTIADDSETGPVKVMDFEEVERRRMQSIGFIAVAVVVCALLGWTIGPTLLEGPFESLTGATVEDPDDLRSMGTVMGLIAGMFVGATGGWVIWSSR